MTRIISPRLTDNLIKAIDWHKNMNEMIFNSPYDVWYFFEGGPGYNRPNIEDSIFFANKQLLNQDSFKSFCSPLDSNYSQYLIEGVTLAEIEKATLFAHKHFEEIEGGMTVVD